MSSATRTALRLPPRLARRAERRAALVLTADERLRAPLADLLHDLGYVPFLARNAHSALLLLSSSYRARFALAVVAIGETDDDARTFLEARGSRPDLEQLPVLVLFAEEGRAYPTATVVLRAPLEVDELSGVIAGAASARG